LQRREAFVIAVAGVPGSRSRCDPGESYSDVIIQIARRRGLNEAPPGLLWPF
jgi:hypothetical protein